MGFANRSELRFPVINTRLAGGRFQRSHQIICASCGTVGNVTANNGQKHLPETMIKKKFQQQGWGVGKKPTDDVCQTCAIREHNCAKIRLSSKFKVVGEDLPDPNEHTLDILRKHSLIKSSNSQGEPMAENKSTPIDRPVAKTTQIEIPLANEHHVERLYAENASLAGKIDDLADKLGHLTAGQELMLEQISKFRVVKRKLANETPPQIPVKGSQENPPTEVDQAARGEITEPVETTPKTLVSLPPRNASGIVRLAVIRQTETHLLTKISISEIVKSDLGLHRSDQFKPTFNEASRSLVYAILSDPERTLPRSYPALVIGPRISKVTTSVFQWPNIFPPEDVEARRDGDKLIVKLPNAWPDPQVKNIDGIGSNRRVENWQTHATISVCKSPSQIQPFCLISVYPNALEAIGLDWQAGDHVNILFCDSDHLAIRNTPMGGTTINQQRSGRMLMRTSKLDIGYKIPSTATKIERIGQNSIKIKVPPRLSSDDI